MMKKRTAIISILVVSLCLGVTGAVFFKKPDLKSIKQRKEKLIKGLEKVKILDDVRRRSFSGLYFELAKIYTREKDYDNAVDLYEQGLRLDSWQKDKIFDLACVYYEKGFYIKAYEKFNQMLDSHPGPLAYIKTKLYLLQLKKYQVFKNSKVYLPVEQKKIKDLTLYLLPFGVKDKEMLDDLRVLLQDAFKVRFTILDPLAEPALGFNAKRNQYFVEPLFEYVNKEYSKVTFVPGTLAVLIITSYDITAQGLNYIFGSSDDKTRTGIVSYKRFLQDNPLKEEFFKRLVTQSLSTAGFLLGMPRCSSFACARSYPHSFAEFKRKSSKLCDDCQKNLGTVLEQLRQYPDEYVSNSDLLLLKEVKRKYDLE